MKFNSLKQVQARIRAKLERWQQIAGVSAERKKAEAERIRKEEEEVLNGQTEGGVDKPGSTNLSDEKDEHGYQFVNAADGTTVFGQIHEDSGLKAAPIKLSEGFNKKDERGNNVGYGLRHIEAGHGDQILEAGYSSVEEFVEDVTRNYREIRIGKDRRTNKTYMLLEIHDDKHKRTLYVELSRDGQYWNVNSGGIFKNKYTDKNDIVWPGPTMGSSANTDVAEVADSPADAVRGVTVDRGGNSSQPISSAGKGTVNSDSVQENDGKNEENGEISDKAAENVTSEGATESELQEENEKAPKETVSPLSEENVEDSVVSDDAGAKVRQKLDIRKKSYEKFPNSTRGFITNISIDLGLEQHEASQYGTFTAKNGKEFTFRISNHNADVRTFDENREEDGISIVISRGRNRGIQGKEEAKVHIKEFFYPKKAIEKAEGKPLVSIIESIEDMLETGDYIVLP